MCAYVFGILFYFIFNGFNIWGVNCCCFGVRTNRFHCVHNTLFGDDSTRKSRLVTGMHLIYRNLIPERNNSIERSTIKKKTLHSPTNEQTMNLREKSFIGSFVLNVGAYLIASLE